MATVTAELMRRGELWQPEPGLTSLRGDVALLHAAIARELNAHCVEEAGDQWSAVAPAPAAGRPQPIALRPAVCNQVFESLAGRVVEDDRCCAIAGMCWRHESGRFTPLERDRSFTMQEVVRVGTARSIHEFRVRGIDSAQQLARRFGLRPRIAAATHPLTPPASRGGLRLRTPNLLRQELLLPVGDGRTIPASTFNDHGTSLADAFDIRRSDCETAVTGCITFAIERWLLAILVEHGPDARDWPIDTSAGFEPTLVLNARCP